MNNLKTDLYALLKAVIGSETVIWANQNSPRPAFPYWTLRISPRRAIGDDWVSGGVDDAGDQTIQGVRESTLQVQRIGLDSDLKVAELQDNLSKTTVSEQFQVKNIALFDVGDVQDIPFVIDASRSEPRASIDLFIRYGTSLLDRVGIIETAAIEAEYVTEATAPNINADLTQNLTVNLS